MLETVVHTADASLGEVIEPTWTKELPLNGGHVLDLALMAPAVHQGYGIQTGNYNPLYWRPSQNSAWSVGGGRPNANYFLLDGSADTDPMFNTLSFSPSPDAVREFKVQTGSYSAEFGGAGGAQVNNEASVFPRGSYEERRAQASRTSFSRLAGR